MTLNLLTEPSPWLKRRWNVKHTTSILVVGLVALCALCLILGDAIITGDISLPAVHVTETVCTEVDGEEVCVEEKRMEGMNLPWMEEPAVWWGSILLGLVVFLACLYAVVHLRRTLAEMRRRRKQLKEYIRQARQENTTDERLTYYLKSMRYSDRDIKNALKH
jgi:hypothetical protein